MKGRFTTAFVSTLFAASILAPYSANAADPRDTGPIVTGWSSADTDVPGASDSQALSATSTAASTCLGHFSPIQRINNTIQYGGWTQCDEPHYLELKIVLWRYIDTSRTWKLVNSVDNARTAYLVNAVNDPPCVPTSKSHYYRMQTYPKVDGVAMVGYAGYSESVVIPCRVDL